MIIEIDFNSEEALYLQLRNQIVLGIATAQFREGDSLPSVRNMAETIGINMHTVNKAYSVLKQEGYVKVDRRRGGSNRYRYESFGSCGAVETGASGADCKRKL